LLSTSERFILLSKLNKVLNLNIFHFWGKNISENW
jgi:hypothetical protein